MSLQLKQASSFVEHLLANQGPDPEVYALLESLCQAHPEKLQALKVAQPDFLCSTESVMGHILQKPYGYAGDFHIIDRIYTNDISVRFEKWDRFSQQNAAALAVRNRKHFFQDTLTKLKISRPHAQVLNVASGSARDLKEFLDSASAPDLRFTCIDLDPRALEYAAQLNRAHSDRISFHLRNALRYQPGQTFDLVWSAGLFDYFEDRVFVHLLKRMRKWVNAGGHIIIGNFNAEHNPSRMYMEVLGEWHLIHRTPLQLIELAKQAGASESQISVEREPEGINLFLSIQV